MHFPLLFLPTIRNVVSGAQTKAKQALRMNQSNGTKSAILGHIIHNETFPLLFLLSINLLV